MGRRASGRCAQRRDFHTDSIDGKMPPMPFNQIQCAALGDWDGDANAAGWRKVYDNVVELVWQMKADAVAEALKGLCLSAIASAASLHASHGPTSKPTVFMAYIYHLEWWQIGK